MGTLSTHQQGIFFVTGASSSVGSAVVQIARILSSTVFATASLKYHAYLRELGANKVFDYRDPEMTSRIVNAAAGQGIYGWCSTSRSADYFSGQRREEREGATLHHYALGWKRARAQRGRSEHGGRFKCSDGA